MKVTLRIAAAGIALLALESCNNPNEIVVMNDVDNKWDKRNIQKLDFKVDDAQNQKNLIFIVRNNNDYPYSNIRLIATLEQDKKIISTDTLNYVLAKPNGEWLGSGFGDTKETLFQYKLNYRFQQNGNYVLRINQAMRRNILPGIEDIGIKIQNVKP